MTRILPTIGVAFAFAVALGAQGTAPAQPQTETSTKSKSKSTMGTSSKNITLTGCLREGDSSGTFVLANVDMSEMRGTSGSHPSTSEASPATGASSASGRMGDPANTVELNASSDLNLRAHVGHRVQVTGTMADKAKMKDKTSGTAGSAAGETATDTTSREKKTGDEKNVHRLNVKSLKHISESCTT
ncbi:MAG TPA: hypothetical protein VK886_20820 [Vicinamibacterales bacterium]|nr:hypothetical protein [Vicinamibacterales bacterium]